MKKIIIAFLTLLISTTVFARISSNPASVEEYIIPLKEMGLNPRSVISFRELVGDTIYFNAFYNLSDEHYDFMLLTPDTVWVKPNKKKAVEGKHYYLLHCYKASYEIDKKNVYLYDYTIGSKICSNDQSLLFRVDKYEGDSLLFITDLNTQQQIYFNPSKLNYKLFISSKKLNDYYAPLLHYTYYTYQKLNKISKKFKRHEINTIEPYITYTGQVKLNTDIIVDGTFSTFDKYVADSLAEVKYWEEYNRPRYVDYVVYNTEIKFDSTKFGDIFLNNVDGHPYILLKSKSALISQAVVDGKMQDPELIPADKLLVFVDCETIRDEEYFVVGRNGRFFYIKAKNNVDLDYTLELTDGPSEFHNSDKIDKFRKSSDQVKKAYTEYAKSLVYGAFKTKIDNVLPRCKSMNSKGLFITDFYVTEEYYSTGLKFSLINLSKKKIKYIVITTKGLNAVDDLIETKTVRCIGPIEPGENAEYEFEHVWWTDLVDSHDPVSMVITYMDGTTMTLKQKDIDACWDDDDFEADRESLNQHLKFKTGVMNATTNKIEPYPTLPF